MKYTIELTENQKRNVEQLLMCSSFYDQIKLEPYDYPVTADDMEKAKECAYNSALEHFDDFYLNLTEKFLDETFPEERKTNYRLFDLIAKYGSKHIIEKYKEWEKYQNDIRWVIG